MNKKEIELRSLFVALVEDGLLKPSALPLLIQALDQLILTGTWVRRERNAHRSPVTQERLRSLLGYDPETGHFTWLSGRFAGQRAGYRDSHGRTRIVLDGRAYQAARLAWFLTYGAWPKRLQRIRHTNGVHTDDRIGNLTLTQKDLTPEETERKRQHTATYKSWAAMHSRCRQPKTRCFERYGGRGIGVCERWSQFANFLADMGPRPSSSCSLERLDNDGHYEPTNCRWATFTEQNRNRSVTRYLTALNKTQCASAWAEELGIPVSTIFSRLRAGWTHERALKR